MSARFQERFVDKKGFFYAGETIIGHMEINVNQPITFHQLTLKFKGKATCRWTERNGENLVLYYNNEVFFNEKIVLLSSPMPSEKIPLAAGQYSYPFSFTLPKDIPPSLNSFPAECVIKYYMKIAFDAESYRAKHDIEEKLPPFKVKAAPADLSKTPHLLEPFDESKDKTLCCLCCKSGPIRLSCHLDKQVFQPGEDILFNVEVDNTVTDQELHKVEAKLIKSVVLFSYDHHRNRYSNDVNDVIVADAVEPGGEINCRQVKLTIPDDITTTIDNCACATISYTFHLCVDIPNAFDAIIEVPLLIANQVQVNQPLSTNLPPLVTAPPPMTIQPGGIEMIPSEPPPPHQY